MVNKSKKEKKHIVNTTQKKTTTQRDAEIHTERRNSNVGGNVRECQHCGTRKALPYQMPIKRKEGHCLALDILATNQKFMPRPRQVYLGLPWPFAMLKVR